MRLRAPEGSPACASSLDSFHSRSLNRFGSLTRLVGFVEVNVRLLPPSRHQLVSQVFGTVNK